MASGLDEDTLQTVQTGRETAGSVLRSAQKNGQKVFVVWVVGLLATISIFRNFLWEQLRRDILHEQMPEAVAEQTRIIVVTPFDVILLQVKIGMAVGILLALPLVIYYSRDALRERGWWPSDKVATWKLGVILAISGLLFCGGILYAYELFFPLMFSFLASNALSAGFQPNYSIVKWVQFVALLGTSFGLAAQLPLLMSALSYTGIVPYETFRDRWKVAVALIFGLGALFSPPDPFTQVLWAIPLVGLYWVSLGISKLLVLTKRAGEEVEARTVARKRWNLLAGTAVLFGLVSYYTVVSEVFTYVQRGVGFVSQDYAPSDVLRPRFFGLSAEASAAAIAAVVGLVAAVAVLYYFMIQELDVAAAEAGHFGDPTAIDVGSLTAEAVRAAPREAFEEMDERESLRLADEAMSEDDPEKARAVLDRYDAVHESDADAESADGTAEGASAADEEEGNVVTSTAAGMFGAFTDDETDEDDIGGYYYDLAFLFDSLTSKAIWFVATFGIIASVVFLFLYSGIPVGEAAVATGADVLSQDGGLVAENVTVASTNATVVSGNGTVLEQSAVVVARNGSVAARPDSVVFTNETDVVRHGSVVYGNESTGRQALAENATVLVQEQVLASNPSGIGLIKNTFVSNLPPQWQDDVRFVNLHPVEHLIFIVKFSSIVGAIATLPLIVYFLWPPLREKGYVSGNRDVLGVWGGTVILTMVLGSLVGFLYVAPTVISWLAADALQAQMILSYRVGKFGWLVVGLTVGLGILAEIPTTMLLFHRGGIFPYETIKERWRAVTVGVFVLSALFSPKGVLTMFLVAVPITIAFLSGLALLWLYTLGGRREPKARRKAAD